MRKDNIICKNIKILKIESFSYNLIIFYKN